MQTSSSILNRISNSNTLDFNKPIIVSSDHKNDNSDAVSRAIADLKQLDAEYFKLLPLANNVETNIQLEEKQKELGKATITIKKLMKDNEILKHRSSFQLFLDMMNLSHTYKEFHQHSYEQSKTFQEKLDDTEKKYKLLGETYKNILDTLYNANENEVNLQKNLYENAMKVNAKKYAIELKTIHETNQSIQNDQRMQIAALQSDNKTLSLQSNNKTLSGNKAYAEFLKYVDDYQKGNDYLKYIEKTQKENSKLKHYITEITNTIDFLKTIASETPTVNSFNILNNDLKEIEKKNKILKNNLKRSREKRKKDVKDLKSLMSDIDKIHEEQIELHKREAIRSESLLNEKNNAVEKLNRENSRLESDKLQLETNLTTEKEDVRSFKALIRTMNTIQEKEIELYKQNIISAESSLNEKKNALTNLEKEKNSLSRDNLQFKKTLSDAKEEIIRAESLLNEKNDAIEKLKRENNSLTQDNLQFKKNLSDAKEEIIRIESFLNEKKNALENLEKEKNSLALNNLQFKKNLSDAKEEIIRAESLLNEKDNAIKKLEKENNSFELDNSQLKKALSEGKENILKFEQIKKNLEKELVKQSQVLNSLKNKTALQKTKYADLINQINNLTDAKNYQYNHINELNKKLIQVYIESNRKLTIIDQDYINKVNQLANESTKSISTSRNVLLTFFKQQSQPTTNDPILIESVKNYVQDLNNIIQKQKIIIAQSDKDQKLTIITPNPSYQFLKQFKNNNKNKVTKIPMNMLKDTMVLQNKYMNALNNTIKLNQSINLLQQQINDFKQQNIQLELEKTLDKVKKKNMEIDLKMMEENIRIMKFNMDDLRNENDMLDLSLMWSEDLQIHLIEIDKNDQWNDFFTHSNTDKLGFRDEYKRQFAQLGDELRKKAMYNDAFDYRDKKHIEVIMTSLLFVTPKVLLDHLKDRNYVSSVIAESKLYDKIQSTKTTPLKTHRLGALSKYVAWSTIAMVILQRFGDVALVAVK